MVCFVTTKSQQGPVPVTVMVGTRDPSRARPHPGSEPSRSHHDAVSQRPLPALGAFLASSDATAHATASVGHGADTDGAGRVLVMIDDAEIGIVIGHCLTAAGFVVRVQANRMAGLEEAERFSPDVVLLDSRAPEFQGTAIVRRLREGEPDGQRAAVITLIRHEGDIDPTCGLELYPCDFVLIPIHARDLTLRIDEIVRARRGRKAAPKLPTSRHYVVGPLEVDVDAYHVAVDGVKIHFSSLEMRLLSYLIEHRGRVRTRRQLLEDVWRYSSRVATRTPDTHVNRLRTKLGSAGSLVETVRGTGYRLSGQYPVIIKE